ncbi:MAG: glycosyltransferase [Bacteroidota bacterium]|nr:glycosyltransferase [Bacteroidota bacterium]
MSIAIPTWNRSQNLQEALTYLLPQINCCKGQIEIIISDNGSTDNTQSIVTKFIGLYPDLNIISNKNKENLGFYGNFRKCREIASGKYFWVLSDDDYVGPGLIHVILKKISESNDLAVIYLKLDKLQQSFHIYNLERDSLLIQEGYTIGLISSVIFLNSKEFDEAIYQKYTNSAFIAFIFLLNAFNYYKNVLVIKGHCLMAANAKPKGYNFFDIFINHMEHVIEYMHFIKLPGKIIIKFRCAYLINFIRQYYIIYKGEKILKFGKFEPSEISSIKEIEFWIHRSYSDLKCYWLQFYLLTLVPAYFFTLGLKIRRLILKKQN